MLPPHILLNTTHPTLDLYPHHCQGTLIFSNISTVYSSFPSATFCFTSLYYPSTTSTIISKHLHTSPSTALSFSPCYSFLYSFLYFSDISVRQTSRLYQWPLSIFILTYVSFFSSFLSSFPMLPCLTFISGVLFFLLHIVIDCHLAGLYSFLLGSPARCTNYCNYLCQ